MMTETELLKAIYEELKVIKKELKKLNNKIEALEVGLIQEEDISEEEAKELDKLSNETRKVGIAWDELKNELGL